MEWLPWSDHKRTGFGSRQVCIRVVLAAPFSCSFAQSCVCVFFQRQTAKAEAEAEAQAEGAATEAKDQKEKEEE